MEQILKQFLKDSEYRAVLNGIKERHMPCHISGMCDSSRPFFISALLKDTENKGFILVSEEKEALRLRDALSVFFERVLIFPTRDLVLDTVSAYSREWEHERLTVLWKCLQGDYDVVIAVPDAVMQYTMPADFLQEISFSLSRGDAASIDKVTAKLIRMGYKRTDIVEGVGQFSVRGGILDIFTPGGDSPVRIDFFGDEIDLIGRFDIVSQRRVENLESIHVLPCSELTATDNTLLAVKREVKYLLDHFEGSEKRRADLFSDLEKAEKDDRCGISDRYFSLIYNQKESILDACSDALRIVVDSKRVIDRARGFEQISYNSIESLAKSGLCKMKNCRPICNSDELGSLLGVNTVLVDTFSSSGNFVSASASYNITTKTVMQIPDKTDIFIDDIQAHLDSSHTVMIVCSGDYSASAMLDILAENDIAAYPYFGVLHDYRIAVASGDFGFYSGFELPKGNFVLYTDKSATRLHEGSMGRKRMAKAVKGERIASYADLNTGDLVVHINHGIGRYQGIQNLVSQGMSRDFIKIVYADGGILYVPCDQLDMVSKYIGAEDTKLSKMGGAEWKRAKAKAKASAANIAKDLIKLYAERRNQPGYAFPPDDELQDEFEAGFEYAETDGQMQAAEEIKRDMQNPYPMDRLLCGDVGFGKTEVSLRAIFKCVFSGKQAAFLVPTTILSLQHYQTLLARFRGYPVKIAMLSRFVTKKEQTEIICKLREGQIDIIVGTHRLLQKDIQFWDLGLLVVDEEQRFGVTHKERLKELAKGVDVLTLTATPIPRTLNMALSGIRDMSVLEEAPMDRVPVQTFVVEQDDEVLFEAIRRELRRGGQVFYLHNFVDSIFSTATRISNAFPDHTVGIAHGQMDKETLSDVWADMVEGKIDILVCTTIIESGINVPNANTLIIEDADRMGLSQLHQIRGRVGRSTRKAYAYLTYRKNKIMNEIAEKRLEAIKEFTEFGSGFKIAMRDLELRGAGNLLGSEQSGHLEAIGYDLYIKILEDAINAEKGIAPVAERNCSIDILCNAFIPENYISSSAMRIDVYKKIASIRNCDDVDDLFDELNDRFGDIPKPTQNLIRVSLIRNTAMECGFTSIEQNSNVLSFYTPTLSIEKAAVIASEDPFKGAVMLSAGGRPHIAYRLREKENNLDMAEKVVFRYLKLSQN